MDNRSGSGEIVDDGQLVVDEIFNDDELLMMVSTALSSATLTSGAGAAVCRDRGDGSAPAVQEPPEAPAAARSAPPTVVYSGPTIQDVEKALASRCPPASSTTRRRYASARPSLFRSRAMQEKSIKQTARVRSGGSKLPNDGYKWRKYGQKLIKNNPHPRSYYRCTHSRCSAKKQIERSIDDPDMLIVTYEGLHLH